MNKNLSWKITLPVGAAIWIIGYILGGVAGDALHLLGFLLVALGLVGAVAALVRGGKDSAPKGN